MKAISLWQPWASLISTGAKRIETRGWRTGYRGPLIICAAKRLVKEEMLHHLCIWNIQGALAPLVGKPLDLTFKSWPGVKLQDIPFGKAVAICCLADCIPVESLTVQRIYHSAEHHFGDYSHGRFGWVLEDIKRIKNPFPVIGRQGFFEVDVPERIELIPV